MTTNLLVPMVVERTGNTERSWDLYSRLLKERQLFITGVVSEEMANIIIAQLLYLRSDDPKKPVVIVISGPGGSVSAGWAILDTVNMLKKAGMPIITVQTSMAASMSSLLAASLASEGRRYILENADTLIHEVRQGQTTGQITTYTDSEDQYLQLKRTNERLVDIYMQRAKVSREKLTEDMKRKDTILTAAEAVEYGLADKIITSFDDIK